MYLNKKKKYKYNKSNDGECLIIMFFLIMIFIYLSNSLSIQIKPRLFLNAESPNDSLSVSNFECSDTNKRKHIGYNITFSNSS